MPQSLAKIYVHMIFSTKNRVPWIIEQLYSYMAAILKAIHSPALIIGGIPDHVHVLAVQSKNIATCKMIEEIKKSSSKWIKTQSNQFKDFRWQNGYGAFSVSPSHKEIVKQYILNQKEHHRQKTFKEEFRDFLKKYEIQYDEKYVWD